MFLQLDLPDCADIRARALQLDGILSDGSPGDEHFWMHAFRCVKVKLLMQPNFKLNSISCPVVRSS